MRFQLPFTLALAALATATPITNDLTKRDGAAVVSAVAEVASAMVNLNSTVNTYNGGFLGTAIALKIEVQCIALAKDLKDAISTAKASANFTDAESLNVAQSFIELQPQIFSTLDNIVAHKPQFDTGLLGIGSLSFLVKYNLEDQKDLAGQLGAAVIPKLTKGFAFIAPLINQQIADAFDVAIAAFD